jgi:hypothetical protein
MATTIVTKNSSTASAVPTAGQLVQGELAVNVADKRLYTEDNAGAIVELGTNPSTLTVTGEITANGGIALGDNDKATFGAGDDLEIYHDGSNSYITESGVGNLYLAAGNLYLRKTTGENLIYTTNAGAVIAHHNGSQKLATTATGIDVTGTATMDGLTVDGDALVKPASGSAKLYLQTSNTTSDSQLIFGDSSNNNVGGVKYSHSNDAMRFEANGTERMRIDSSGRVGIGTSSPATLMEMASTSPVLRITNTTDSAWSAGDDIGRLSFYSTDSSAVGAHETAFILNESDFGSGVTQLSGALSFGTAAYNAAAVERMRIDSSGNVGIGCSPSYPFEVQSGGVGTVLRAGTASVSIDPVGSASAPSLIFNGDANTGFWRPASDTLAVSTAGVERLRIDASGNLLVGKTADNNAVAGVALSGSGIVKVARTDWSLLLNRLTTDGDIALFQKDGATVGSIGTTSGRLFVGNGDVGLRFAGDLDFIAPWDATTNAARDNAISLGNSGNRFKDLYLSGGVYLGGTGAANHLDDYEEGTCNMKWSDGTNHSTVIASKYTKVGRLVTVSGYASGNISGLTGATAVQLAGFPFAFSDYGSFALRTRNINAPAGCIGLIGFHGNSGAFATLTFIVDNANYVSVLVSDMSATTNDAYFDVTYQTT